MLMRPDVRIGLFQISSLEVQLRELAKEDHVRLDPHCLPAWPGPSSCFHRRGTGHQWPEMYGEALDQGLCKVHEILQKQ